MNRFAFPSEWMAKNWPQTAVSEDVTTPVTDVQPTIEIRISGVVMQVAGEAVLQTRQDVGSGRPTLLRLSIG